MTAQVSDLWPEWFRVARGELGVCETPGDHDTARVIEYLRSTTTLREGMHDETPWCSAFVNWCFAKVGISPTRSAAARSWITWGDPLKVPRIGAVVVFSRDDAGPRAGHVGFWVGQQGKTITVLGGNQKNSVCEAQYAASRLLGYRWPSKLRLVKPDGVTI
jgi:uncharacterized protein (TIGR02594 family)